MDEERAAALAQHLVQFRQQNGLSAFAVLKMAIQGGYGLAMEDQKNATNNTAIVLEQLGAYSIAIEAATR